jgi:hypothetical protein
MDLLVCADMVRFLLFDRGLFTLHIYYILRANGPQQKNETRAELFW